jgi:hypothetical protein
MKTQITEAFEMGYNAMKSGHSRIPAQNKELMSIVFSMKSDLKKANNYMKSWIAGFTEASLEAMRKR